MGKNKNNHKEEASVPASEQAPNVSPDERAPLSNKPSIAYVVKKFGWLFSILIFAALFLVIYSGVNYALRNKTSMENISTFYEEPADSIDVIFAGTSHPLFTFSPMEMWNSNGIVSYNMAQGGQMFPLTYYSIKESLRLQSPKVVVLDLYYLIKQRKFGDVERAHSTLDNFQWSHVKAEAILDAVNPDAWGECFFPLITYHSRWDTLSKRDFSVPTNVQRGYSRTYTIAQGAGPEITQTTQAGGISDATLEYLHKTIDLCKSNNVPLVFTVVPYSVGKDNDPMGAEQQLAIFNQAFAIAKENNIPCVNYFELLDEIDFDFETDMLDLTHANSLGAAKVSRYMANYLSENFALPDRRNEPAYSRWHTDYSTYLKEGLAAKSSALSRCETLTGYLELISEEEDYLILMNLGGGNAKELSDKQIDELRGMGIDTDLRDQPGKSWAAVIDGGRVTYEMVSEEQIKYEAEYGNLPVKIYSYGKGSYFHIFVDGEKVGVNKRGLNIVVYSKTQKKVIDSVSFNVGSSDCKASRKSK